MEPPENASLKDGSQDVAQGEGGSGYIGNILKTGSNAEG